MEKKGSHFNQEKKKLFFTKFVSEGAKVNQAHVSM